MLNDFTTIDAQDGVSTLALIVPEELAEVNAYYDELQEEIDSAFEIAAQSFDTASDQRWEGKMDLLRSIHEEIRDVRDRKRGLIYDEAELTPEVSLSTEEETEDNLTF